VAGGHVNGGLSGLSSTVSLAKAKKVRLLTIFSESKSPIFPDVPTIEQDTGKKIEVPGPIGVFGPPNMPQDVKNILVKAMAEVAKDPEVIKQLTSQGLESTPLGPDEFKTAIFKQWDLVNSMKDLFR
jgi:tripartite-type tricarboxylate transporter receptor subunit TctC